MTRTHHPTRRRLALALSFVGAVSVAVAACSGPAKQVAPTTIVITLPSTIAPATTAPATATVATSAPASTDASTSAASTTTTSAAPTPEQAVRAAWHGWIAAVEACYVGPTSCDRRSLSNVMSGSVLDNTAAAIDEIVAKRWRVRLGDGNIDERYKIEQVRLNGDAAQVDNCQLDAGITDIPGSGPNGEDVLVSDAIGTRWGTVELRRGSDDRWRVSKVISDHVELGDARWTTCVAG